MTKPIHLVTGAAGFIGSHLVDRLLGQGIRVVGIDNLIRGRMENIAPALANPDFTFFEGAIDNPDTFKSFVGARIAEAGPIEAVWHMAANSDIAAGTEDLGIDLRDTFMTTVATLATMKSHGIRRLAFASSSAIYGDHGARRVAENDGPLLPISNYGAMKLASEAAISAAVESHLERAWIFRFPNVVGGRGTHGVLYDFLNKLEADPSVLNVLGNGTQRKPYLHVADLVDAMLHIAENGKERVNYFNIGPEDEGVNVRYIAETVVAEASPGAEIRYGSEGRGWVGDVPKFAYSTAKLTGFGWSPSCDSAAAIVRSIRELIAERRGARQ